MLQELIELYFDNKLKTIPYGADKFFLIYDEILKLRYDSNLDITEHDINSIVESGTSVTAIIGHRRGKYKGKNLAADFLEVFREKKNKNPRGLILNITGSPQLSSFDIYGFMGNMTKFINKDTKVICGTVINDMFKDDLVVTALVIN